VAEAIVPSDRLSGSEKRALVLWVLAGIVGAVFAQKHFFRAFPEASVDFKVSRGEALKHARDFVTSLGENIEGYRTAILFNVDDNAKTYLERQLGLQQANQMMSSQLNVWYWDARFFRPLQEEEFKVRVSPAGNIVGYEHKIQEAHPGASLERTAAQAQAEKFLTSKVGIHLKEWDFLPEQVNSEKRTNRLDWSFTWEKHGFRAKDAPYRLEASIKGDRIGGTEQYLQVPEEWIRSYGRLRSGNDTLALAFFVLYFVLLGVALWLGIRLWKAGQTSWRGAILLGLVVAALLFLQNLNDWPHWPATYDTNQTFGTFLFLEIVKAVLFGLASAVTITLVLPAAEPLYRAAQPGRLQLVKVLTPRGLRSKEFFSAAVVGLSLAAAHIGYVVAFYIVAGHFGAWAPQELNFDNSVNTLFPWISGAAIGLLASTNEEFTFRLFAIPFFERLTRSRWIAVILPAFLWSFLHSNYPQEPAYTRGIEIGIFGVVAGIVMLRWGILATLIWHYTVDASLVGLLLIRSNSLYFKVSGIVVGAAAVAPLLFAGVSYLARGRFEPDEDLLNSALPKPEISLAFVPSGADSATAGRRYEALASATIGILTVCLVAGGVVTWRLKPETIGNYLKLSTNARTARAAADEIIERRGLSPGSYYQPTVFVNNTDPYTNEFLRERLGIRRLNEIYASRVPMAFWHVRYFRDGEPEEFAVVLKPDGSLHSVHHVIAEATPGASLTKEEAVARAEKFLREEKKMDLGRWALVEANSDKRPHRTDHVLTWQEKEALDSGPAAPQDEGHAYARVTLAVLGDEVTAYRIFVKIPDEWRRKHKELTLSRILVNWAVPVLVWAGLGVTAFIAFLRSLRSETARSVPWRRISLWALYSLAGYALIVALGNFFPGRIHDQYETAVPFKFVLAGLGIGVFLGAIFNFGAVALLFGVSWYYGKQAFGEERIPSWTSMPAKYYRDALWIGLGGAATLIGLRTLLQTAAGHFAIAHRYAEASFGTDFDAIVPLGSIFGGALLHGLMFTGIVTLVASYLAAEVRNGWTRLLVFVFGALALVGSNWGDPKDLAMQFAIHAILLAVIIFGVIWVMRFNVLGCFLALVTVALVNGAAELLGQADRFYRANGYGLILLLVAMLAWPVFVWRTHSGEARGTSRA
jgi:membrane protease YdiL (CAAX protease family)